MRMYKKNIKNIPYPSVEEIKKYKEKRAGLQNYVNQEKSLNLLFNQYKNNTDICEILLKVSVLNDFYSTNIFGTYKVAENIQNLKIDEAFKQKDISIVDKIATVKIKNKNKYFFSFATKYCSISRPDNFMIYDSFGSKFLLYCNNHIKNFSNYKKNDIRKYENYIQFVEAFKKSFDLESVSYKDLDTYIWLAGKEYFSKKKD